MPRELTPEEVDLLPHGPGRPPGESKWTQFFDGKAREFIAGTDFKGDSHNFCNAVYMAGQRLGVKVRTNRLRNGNVVVQSLGPR